MIIPVLRPIIPSYVQVSAFGGNASNGVTTTFNFSYPVAAVPHSTRRLVVGMCAQRDTDLGVTLNSAAFSNGSNDIAATIHDQEASGNSSSNNTVFGAIASAIVPTNDYTQLKVNVGGSFAPGVYSILALYGRTSPVPGTGNVAATHSGDDNWAISADVGAGQRFVGIGGGFSGTANTSWDKGTELSDTELESIVLCTMIDDRPAAEIGKVYNLTLSNSFTARMIGGILFE